MGGEILCWKLCIAQTHGKRSAHSEPLCGPWSQGDCDVLTEVRRSLAMLVTGEAEHGGGAACRWEISVPSS